MRMACGFLALAALAGTASAEIAATANLIKTWDFGTSFNDRVVTPGARFSNVTSFGGSGFKNGGTGAISGILTTKYVTDDLAMTGAVPSVTRFTWSVANFNATATTARMRVRWHLPDGPGGTPGTYITGFSFAASALPVGVSTFFADTSTTPFALPANCWMGICFDNSGAAATTAAQLDNLGVGLFNPPDVGTSGDVAFLTSAASVGNVNNPAGGTFNFGGAPVANFGWEVVPAPASMALIGLGGLVAGRRRR